MAKKKWFVVSKKMEHPYKILGNHPSVSHEKAKEALNKAREIRENRGKNSG